MVKSLTGVIPLILLKDGALSSVREVGGVFRISFTAYNNQSSAA
jgi:hypothetical protein